MAGQPPARHARRQEGPSPSGPQRGAGGGRRPRHGHASGPALPDPGTAWHGQDDGHRRVDPPHPQSQPERLDPPVVALQRRCRHGAGAAARLLARAPGAHRRARQGAAPHPADARRGRRPRAVQPGGRHLQPPGHRLAIAIQGVRLADPRRGQQGARQRSARAHAAGQALGDDRRPQPAAARDGGGRVHLQGRAAARRGRARRQLLRLDLGQGAARVAHHAAAPVPHARAHRPRRVRPLLRRQAHPRGAAPAHAAAVAFRPRAGVGRHRCSG